MRFCTAADAVQLPEVRSLADRISELHGGDRLTVAIDPTIRLRDGEPFDAVAPPPGDADPATIAPSLLRRLAAGDGPLVFLTPAHELLAPLDALDAALEHHPVLLSPRVRGELPEDGRRPDAADLAEHGRIDPGFVALRPGPEAEAFLDWWTEHAADERVLDRAAAELAFVAELDDDGVEAGGWNLHERPLAHDGAILTAGGVPLVSLQLTGFRPERPFLLADDVTRTAPSSDPILRDLLTAYAERLRERGWTDLPRRAEIGRRLANGEVFSERLLRLYTRALAGGEDFGDVFAPDGTARFMAWLTEAVEPGARYGLTRYLHQVYRDRPDLPGAYPDLAGEDGGEYAGWCWVYGRRELDIPDVFLPPPPDGSGIVAPGPPAGVTVAGYFTGTLGLGEAARLYVTGLAAAGVPVGTRTVDAELPVEVRRTGEDYGRVSFEERHEVPGARVNLICVNAEELPRFAAQVGESFFAGRTNIGIWAWETDVVPRRWDEAFGHLDEIWVYSRYVAENLGRVSPIPVVVVPPPVLPPAVGPEPELGLPDGFRFMFMFDFFSTVKRKNAVGVVEAFKRAFAPGEGPHLVIKTIHAEERIPDYEQLLFAVAGRPDIVVVDRSLAVPEKNGLLASCDCYVSLHRSEGWGLPLAECMAMGKPVIATAYSGNLDFMTPGNSYLVDYALTNVGGDVEIYPAEGTWAEPDLDHAAAQMRAVWTDPDEAARRGRRAGDDITALLSPERAGAIARARLAHVTTVQRHGPTGEAVSMRATHERAAATWSGGAPGPLGLKRLARRLLFRMLRPSTLYERLLGQARDSTRG